jgi:hypothetical protein
LANTYTYFAFGLVINSEIELKELPEIKGNPDVIIRFGIVPDVLENFNYKGVCFEAMPGKLLLKPLNIARYLIINGNEIIVEPIDKSNEPAIRLFLLGSAMGALLHQRNILPLHGSCINFNNQAVVFAGVSGSGKSTLSAKLCEKGYPSLADDISAISFNKEAPILLPGIPQLKLWRDSLIKLKIETSGLQKVRAELEKYLFPVDNFNLSHKMPLKKIYIISTKNQAGTEIEKINGIDKFNLLKTHTYRYNFVRGMNLELSHFKLASGLASKIEVCKLSRESNGFEIDKLADIVIDDLNRF